MKARYDLLIVGATVYGAAAAERYKDLDVAVIESGCTCGAEFSAAYKGEEPCPSDNALYRELSGRHAIRDGKIWLPAVAPVTAHLLSETGADCRFFSTLTDIRSEEGGYAVTFVCYGVEYRLTVRRILDTTSTFITRGWFGRRKPECSKITLNCIDETGGIRKTPVSGDIDDTRLSVKSERKIVMIAPEPDITQEKSDTDIWQPSAAYENAVEAYEAGMRASLPEPVSTVIPAVRDEGEYDVIVAGVGTAGSSAALKAAAEGMKVLAIDSMPVPGGTATAGGIYTYYFGFKGGLYKEIDALAAENPSFTPEPGVGGQPKILALLSEMKKAGVDYRCRASFVKAEVSGRRVTGIRWMEDGEEHAASSRTVIDCTAEAAVCVNAGCRMLGGRASDGEFQPFSSVFFTVKPDGSCGFGYCDNGTVDPYDADDFGKKVLGALGSYIHLRGDYGDRSYLGTAPLIGLREGRKIVGEETVSFDDLIHGRYTDRPVYYGRSNLDNHGKDDALEDRIYRDWVTICGMWGWCLPIPVPAGALIPKGWDGLLAAGRDVSVEHNLAMGLRMKDDAYKSGEAAAVIAALSVRQGIPLREVDAEEVRAELRKTNCLNVGGNIMDLEQQTGVAWFHEPWWTDDDDAIREQLAGDSPGYAIWSAAANGKSGLLGDLLASEDRNTRWHAALAFSLINDHPSPCDEAVDALLEAAFSRDGFIPKSGRKYNNLRAVSAISALGRLADGKAAEPLLTLLGDLDFTEKLKPTDAGMAADAEDIRFEFESHIIVALCEIAAANPDKAPEIRDRLKAYMRGRRFRVSMMGTRLDLKKDCTDSLAGLVEKIRY
jgi:hypothetical protein